VWLWQWSGRLLVPDCLFCRRSAGFTGSDSSVTLSVLVPHAVRVCNAGGCVPQLPAGGGTDTGTVLRVCTQHALLSLTGKHSCAMAVGAGITLDIIWLEVLPFYPLYVCPDLVCSSVSIKMCWRGEQWKLCWSWYNSAQHCQV